jgi:hypothetical protein
MGINICTINSHIKLSIRAHKLRGAGTGNEGSEANYPKARRQYEQTKKIKVKQTAGN